MGTGSAWLGRRACINVLPLQVRPRSSVRSRGCMCLVVLPVTIVNVTICMNESSPAVSFVDFPVTLIYAAIRPNLIASTMPQVRFLSPFTLVLGTVLQYSHGAMLFFYAGVVVFILIETINEFRKLLTNILNP